MLKKALISAFLLALGCLHLGAQGDYRKAFEEFTAQAKKSHAAFTDTANVLFAKAIGANWEKYDLSEANKSQVNPEPESLPVAEETQTLFKVVAVTEKVDTIPARWPLETESSLWKPVEQADRRNSRVVRFVFYDAEQLVTVPKEYGSFHPKGIKEDDVAAFWEELSRYDYKFILADCAKYAELHGYNDWAILEWVQALSAAVFPQNTNSESTIFTVFLLNQMGLMTKLARADNELISMFTAMQPVYARKFIVIDTYPFYLAEKNLSASEVFTYSTSFVKPAHPLDLRIHVAPAFGKPESFTTCQKYSSLFNTSFDIPLNRALMRFYGRYPQTAVNVYASAQPEVRFSNALKTALSEGIKSLPELDAVNMLLAFVQSDFKYQTDINQFGYEKPFFCEENFFFECNDCEDRATLFALLVRSLLRKKVVLLEYPDHISTAVQMPGELKGDHIRIGEDKYYVCDPSYIGATLGMTIPKYKNISVKVYAL